MHVYKDPKYKPGVTKINNFIHTHGVKPVMEFLKEANEDPPK